MKLQRVLIVILILAAAGISLNQWRLSRAVQQLGATAQANQNADASVRDFDSLEEKLRQAEARHLEARAQLQIADQKLANASAQISQLDNRLRQLETALQSPLRFQNGLTPGGLTEDTGRTVGLKRSWGPEQASGEPDTLASGDIPTAWAPREQDGGEEWLKLDYEKFVDIAEVRVRETHNPGAISKVTAFLANGSEVTLWEGVEPKADAPVEMSFRVPDSVNAKSVKVYLDTTRVPGWNEIDAVQIIGRDGSQQWAKDATASSTYAEPRLANRARSLERF